MRYEHLEDLDILLSKKLISCRPHPSLPLKIYNYTASAQALKIDEWTEALCDCRGLILTNDGEIVGRPFRKFFNYEQVLDKIPNEPFTVAEKLDGSLGIVCLYGDNLVIATRGSFESEQARWAREYFKRELPGWYPLEGLTFLFEFIYPSNRIVVDYGSQERAVLLAVLDLDGSDNLKAFEGSRLVDRARSFPPSVFTNRLYEQDIQNAEGYVVRWANGFRAKVKFEEYKRLHRLITQISTRTIWELLRAGKSTEELVEKVPDDFKDWVEKQIDQLLCSHGNIVAETYEKFISGPYKPNRKEFAEWALENKYPHLLFALYDDKAISDLVWKLVEPKWATPFRREVEG